SSIVSSETVPASTSSPFASRTVRTAPRGSKPSSSSLPRGALRRRMRPPPPPVVSIVPTFTPSARRSKLASGASRPTRTTSFPSSAFFSTNWTLPRASASAAVGARSVFDLTLAARAVDAPATAARATAPAIAHLAAPFCLRSIFSSSGFLRPLTCSRRSDLPQAQRPCHGRCPADTAARLGRGIAKNPGIQRRNAPDRPIVDRPARARSRRRRRLRGRSARVKAPARGELPRGFSAPERSHPERLPRGLLGPAVVGLAARRAHDRVDEDERLRELVARDVARGRVAEHVLGRLVAGPQDDERGHLLAPALARRAGDDRIVDRVVVLQRLLDLLREDLLAARVDADRVAPEHDDLPLRGELRTVARHRIADAVDHGIRPPRLRLVAEVAERHVPHACDPAERARVPARELPRHPLVEEDRLLVHLEGALLGVDARHADGRSLRAGLRRPEAVEDDQPRDRGEERLLVRRGEDRPARAEDLERRHVVRLRPELIEERAREGVADDREREDALALHGPPDVVRVERARVFGDAHRPALVKRDERRPVRGAVHERRRGQHAERLAAERSLRHLVDASDRGTAQDPSAHRAEEDVLLAPEDAL